MTETALISGASSGIGLEFARIFASNKINVVLVARGENKLRQLAEEISRQVTVHVIAADLSKMGDVERVFNEVQQKNIAIDYLINNAGFGNFGMFYETDWNKEAMMIDLNVKSLTHMTKMFVKEMVKRQKGKIVNLASTAAFQPGPTMAVYYATKAYVLSFSEAISNELKGTGVSVTVLCPGPTATGFQKASALEESKLVKGKKLPSAKEVAEYGYNAMMKGRVVAVPGFANKFFACAVRVMPRSMVRNVVRKMQEKA